MTCRKTETQGFLVSSAGLKVTPRASIVPHRRLFVPCDYVPRALCFALMTHKRQAPR